ncbi:hypothetical protein D9M71_627210 [compost metagenome]
MASSTKPCSSASVDDAQIASATPRATLVRVGFGKSVATVTESAIIVVLPSFFDKAVPFGLVKPDEVMHRRGQAS